MELTVTYVRHNCFCLRAAGRVLVFDYPAEKHRGPEAEAIVARAAKGRRAVALFSHSHADHCSPDVARALAGAAEIRWVLSYDVPDMIPELDPEGAGPKDAVVLEPGDDPRGGDPGPWTAVDDELTVAALESNDLGVAFLIRLGPLRVYYGGDLALWAWPGTDEAAQAQVRAYFDRSLEAVRAFNPHLAFTDCDHRLPDRAGFTHFAHTVRPPLLVPTHDFGMPEPLREYAATIHAPGVTILTYDTPGHEMTVTVDP